MNLNENSPLAFLSRRVLQTWVILCCFTIFLHADVKGTGNIGFDSRNDGTLDAILTSTGLAIGANGASPSANLEVQGNALISQQLSIGSAQMGSSNLTIHGTMALSYQTVSSNTMLGDHSIVLAGNASSNLLLTLPNPVNRSGLNIVVKKTESEGKVTITGAGNTIDFMSEMILKSGNLGSASLVSDGSQWYVNDRQHAESALHSSNLFLWLPFEDGSGNITQDHSGNAYTLVRENFDVSGNGSIAGGIGQCLQFDGVDDRLYCSSNTEFMPDSDMSISLWVRFETLPSVKAGGNSTFMVRKPHAVAPWHSYSFLATTADKIKFAWLGTSETSYNVTSTQSVSAGVWYHMVGTVSDKLRVYINGVLDVTGGVTVAESIFKSDRELRIGYQAPSGGHYSHISMDDFRLYDRALSADDIAQLYRSGVP